MDHIEDSGGIEDALAADVKYDLDDGWAKSIKFGARYSNQDQTVRYTSYNWGVVSEVWAGPGAIWFAQPNATNSVDPTDTFDSPDGSIEDSPRESGECVGVYGVVDLRIQQFPKGSDTQPDPSRVLQWQSGLCLRDVGAAAPGDDAQWVANGGYERLGASCQQAGGHSSERQSCRRKSTENVETSGPAMRCWTSGRTGCLAPICADGQFRRALSSTRATKPGRATCNSCGQRLQPGANGHLHAGALADTGRGRQLCFARFAPLRPSSSRMRCIFECL